MVAATKQDSRGEDIIKRVIISTHVEAHSKVSFRKDGRVLGYGITRVFTEAC